MLHRAKEFAMRLAVVAVLALASAAASAQSAYLGPSEARRVFYGIDMRGKHQPSNQDWRECIDPDGKTSYWFQGAYDQGRLTVRGDGALCFSYASSDYERNACWKVRRLTATTYRFESADGDAGVFVATATRPAQSCPDQNAPVS
jgi:hypothetical protein